MAIPISVTILTKNSQRYLKEVLDALTSFDEVLIYDTGSHDATLEIAQRYKNVTVYKRSFVGFGPTHNLASNLSRHDWVLSIDSDEIVTPALSREILSIPLQKGCVYSFPRHNEYRGKWIKWCGWHPDRQVRLYNRQETCFTDAQVHESIITTGLKEIKLQNPLRHYSYESVSNFLSKMQSYSELFALQNQGRKQSSLTKAILHGIGAFLKSYILKRGFLGGQEGFEISIYNGNTAFYKYLKLAEANRRFEESAEKFSGARMKKPAVSNVSKASTLTPQPETSPDK